MVVSATGTWDQPFWPAYPGAGDFGGRQLHTAGYRTPEEFTGQRVVVVGGGNSAAQILAEVSTVAETVWVTPREPRFLPDEVDGRALFAAATERVRAQQEGREHPGVGGLGDIVTVASVQDARDRGVLEARPMFTRLTQTGIAWDDGSRGARRRRHLVHRVPPGASSPLTAGAARRPRDTSRPVAPAPGRSLSRGVSWSGTATGPARLPRRFSASGEPPAT